MFMLLFVFRKDRVCMCECVCVRVDKINMSVGAKHWQSMTPRDAFFFFLQPDQNI